MRQHARSGTRALTGAPLWRLDERGEIDAAKDIPALRRFAGLTQEEFAEALGISVHTLRNWEQGRRRPDSPAIAQLRIATRRPSVLRENLAAPA